MVNFIHSIIGLLDSFFAVLIHNSEHLFFSRKLKSTWLSSMSEVSKLESLIKHQVNILKNIKESENTKKDLGMLQEPIDEDEELYLKEIAQKNDESLAFFNKKLKDIERIKTELQELMIT